MHLGLRSYKPSLSLGVKHHKPYQSLGVRFYLNSTSNNLLEPKSHHDIYNHVTNSDLVHRIPMTHTNFGGVQHIAPFAGREQSAHIEKERRHHHQRFT